MWKRVAAIAPSLLAKTTKSSFTPQAFKSFTTSSSSSLFSLFSRSFSSDVTQQQSSSTETSTEQPASSYQLVTRTPSLDEAVFDTARYSEPFESLASRPTSEARMRRIQIGPQKLNDICRTIRGLSVHEALIQLKFSPKKKAKYVHNVIKNAAVSAVNNFGMAKDRLYVAEAVVGHGTHLKRWDIKGRGRYGIKKRYFSNLVVKVKEQDPVDTSHKNHKFGGRHHRYEQEVRIGRAGRTTSTIQKTLDAIQQFKAQQQFAKEFAGKITGA